MSLCGSREFLPGLQTDIGKGANIFFQGRYLVLHKTPFLSQKVSKRTFCSALIVILNWQWQLNTAKSCCPALVTEVLFKKKHQAKRPISSMLSHYGILAYCKWHLCPVPCTKRNGGKNMHSQSCGSLGNEDSTSVQACAVVLTTNNIRAHHIQLPPQGAL